MNTFSYPDALLTSPYPDIDYDNDTTSTTIATTTNQSDTYREIVVRAYLPPTIHHLDDPIIQVPPPPHGTMPLHHATDTTTDTGSYRFYPPQASKMTKRLNSFRPGSKYSLTMHGRYLFDNSSMYNSS